MHAFVARFAALRSLAHVFGATCTLKKHLGLFDAYLALRAANVVRDTEVSVLVVLKKLKESRVIARYIILTDVKGLQVVKEQVFDALVVGQQLLLDHL